MIASASGSLRCKDGESVSHLCSVYILQTADVWHSLLFHDSAMEDAHAAILDLDEGQQNSNAFFAVYDGHGGES